MNETKPALGESFGSVSNSSVCVSRLVAEPSSAVLISGPKGDYRIITKYDLIHSVRGKAR